MTTKMTAIAGIGLTLFALNATGAFAAAGSATPDPTLTEVFYTDNNKIGFNSPGASISTTLAGRAGSTYVQSAGQGVGYSPSNFDNIFPGSSTVGTSQSIFQTFTLPTSIASGSLFQIGLHGDAATGDGTNLSEGQKAVETIYASILNATGQVVDANIPVAFDATRPSINDYLYYSPTVTLTNGLTAGTQYTLALSPTSPTQTNPSEFVVVDTIASSKSNITDPSYQTIIKNDTNSGNSPVGGIALSDPGPLAYRFYASAAPEPAQCAYLGASVLFLGLMGFAGKRRRAA